MQLQWIGVGVMIIIDQQVSQLQLCGREPLAAVNSMCCLLRYWTYALFNKLRVVIKAIKQFWELGPRIKRKPKVFHSASCGLCVLRELQAAACRLAYNALSCSVWVMSQRLLSSSQLCLECWLEPRAGESVPNAPCSWSPHLGDRWWWKLQNNPTLVQNWV